MSKTDKRNQGFNSRTVHAGYHAQSGPVNPPIEECSTYAFETCDDGATRFASRDKKGIYSRLYNPTVSALEDKLADLEHGYGGIATASGMAATNAIYYHFLDKNSHAVTTASMYGPSRTILEEDFFYGKWGCRATFVDTSDLDLVKKAIRPETRLIYIETPANPTLSITNIKKVSEIAHGKNIPLVVDNTFCSPFLQNPLDLGADVVVHSMTKSIGGHADAVGGMIISKTEKDFYDLRNIVMNTGATLSPHSAALFFKGVKTLGLRMTVMQDNAIALADYLRNHPRIEWVVFPGFDDHPKYDLVKSGTQMKGPGSMICFGVKGGLNGARTFMNSVRLNTIAVSLGGVESLLESPALMTHAGIPKEKREEAGIKDELVRYSVGIEDVNDLKADLESALEKVS
ncbi:MAG: aminotransferase class I/II-fold pyridoxal phosphate-dependent enzyme [candidate division Zixibacteria bacterium]|nr:aminotransferase class I/II-fold pyridoxal phosphate-dependent enzyme [candidate division Zixibacteria bacterium]